MSAFRLPGEAQKIDRIVKSFATVFSNMNVENLMFGNVNEVYVLSFSVVMLNTDAHNPNVPKEQKMGVNEFVNNVSGALKTKVF